MRGVITKGGLHMGLNAKVTSMALAGALMFSACGNVNTENKKPETTEDSSVVTESVESAETKTSDAPEWVNSAVVYEVNVRQYTPSGTFNEFAEHLEELKAMGINTLWFMPIHPISKTNRSGTLGSYYSVDNYTEVNPEFGTKEDFKALVDKAHEMGFHVVMDWVANHTGWDNPWISEHPDWYTQVDGKIISPDGMGWPDVADLNYDSEGLRKEMIASMKYWIDEFDVDGFRCDYAPGVPVDFWEEAREALDEDKDVFMLAEDLGWINGSLLDYAFDSNYNSKFYETLVDVARDRKTADKLKLYWPKMPESTFPLNYLDNHDVNSYDRTIAEAFSGDAMPASLGLIFTLPGVPMIYSGDEIGYDHAIEFMEKDPIDWNEKSGDYRELIATLAEIKKDNKALQNTGDAIGFEFVDVGNKNIIAFERTSQDERIVYIANYSPRLQTEIDLSVLSIDGGEILYSDKAYKGIEENIEPADISELEPYSFYIIRTTK